MASLMIRRMDMMVLLDYTPLAPSNAVPADFRASYLERPAWIAPSRPKAPPEVTAYRLHFELPQAAVIRTHVTANERYLLFVDGQHVGHDPERGSDNAWFYETYDLDLKAGQHILAALVWQLGEIGPRAQIGLAGGFLLQAGGSFGDLLSTKSAAWETRPVSGISFSMPSGEREVAWFVDLIQTTDGAAYPCGVEAGEGEGWEPASTRCEDFGLPFGIRAVHVLQPASLPAQMAALRRGGRVRYVANTAWSDPHSVEVVAGANLPAEKAAWQFMVDGSTSLVIPPHTHHQVVHWVGMQSS
jgi:alpha-L-rhamnosidase